MVLWHNPRIRQAIGCKTRYAKHRTFHVFNEALAEIKLDRVYRRDDSLKIQVMKPRRVILDRHARNNLYFLALYEIIQLRRAKTEENPLVIVSRFTYAVENRLDIVYNFMSLLKRNYFAFFVLPNFFSGRKFIFPAHVSRCIFTNAINVIMRQRRNNTYTGLVFIFLELVYLLFDVILIAEKRMRQKIWNCYDVFLWNII